MKKYMRLRDKKTGEIGYLYANKNENYNVLGDDGKVLAVYPSLAELCERFEDAPEEKPFEEVAKVGFVVAMTAEKTIEDRHGRVDKIEVADRDYYEILPDGTKKTEFTWNEAMEIEKKTHGKWRVPTQAEWFSIAVAFGRNKDGEIAGKALAKNLNLITDEDDAGNFWSSTPSNSTVAWYLYFNNTYVDPQSNSLKVNGLTVRCVTGEGKSNGKV